MMMWSGWGLHWAWMLVAWVVVIGLVIWAVARLVPTSPSGRAGARRILDERYARGEIDEEEYRRRRGELDR